MQEISVTYMKSEVSPRHSTEDANIGQSDTQKAVTFLWCVMTYSFK